MILRLRAFTATFGVLRGFITVPGLISLGGLLLAVLTLAADHQLQLTYTDQQFSWLMLTNEAARQILSTVASSAMAALSLVYSTVLVVFTLAAGTIAPRLLQRFSEDRTSQVAVGLLGATFLFCLIIMHALEGNRIPEVSLTMAMLLAVMSVLMLLVFVNKAAKRVTIDEEVAAISHQLDDCLAHATAQGNGLSPDEVVRPDGDETAITARRSGYVVQVFFEELTAYAAEKGVFIDLFVVAGDYVIQDQPLGQIVGPGSSGLEDEALQWLIIDRSRTPTDDLRFSVRLLVEIGLRALSPGVNDTYTAVVCVDRLSSSLRQLRLGTLGTGVFEDENGAARLVAPMLSAGELITGTFGPFRWAARDNMLMIRRLVLALGRLGLGEQLPGEDAIREQLELIRAETATFEVLSNDKRQVEQLIDWVLANQVGRPLSSVGMQRPAIPDV